MAPNVAKSTLELIYEMMSSGESTASQMAAATACSKRAIIASLGTYFETAKRLFLQITVPFIAHGFWREAAR